MTHTKMQDDFYYVVLKGRQRTRWMADERVKKQFLDHLLNMRRKFSFRVYAFCILDKEAHFLLSIPSGRSIEHAAEKISRELMRIYLNQYPQGKEEADVTKERLSQCSYSVILEYCCRIHLLARGYSERMQDYWWSSYVEYLHKNITGLVETEAILRILDAEPHRALQKFIQYHEKYIPLIENESKRKK